MEPRAYLLTPLIVAVALFLSGSPALSADSAWLVAGWDFSQYSGAGLLSIDGSTYTDTLDANYSSFDPTNNCGAESAQFGTMYIDGSFGSTDIDAGSGTEEFVPTAGSLVSQIELPTNASGIKPFDSHAELAGEGQAFTEFLAMTATAPAQVVFHADLTAVPETATTWGLTFAGKTFSGTSTVDIESSTDGSSYVPVDSIVLDTDDNGFGLLLWEGASDEMFVRLTFATAAGQPIIDNLGIWVRWPLTAIEARCVNGLNKNYEKLFRSVVKDAETCARDAARNKDLSPATNALDCLTADRRGKVAKAKDKNENAAKGADAKLCTCDDPDKCTIPHFGYNSDVAAADQAVVAAAVGLQNDFFGSAADLSLADALTEEQKSKCQLVIQKDVNRLARTYYKLFTACKKEITKPAGGKADKVPPGATNPAEYDSDLWDCTTFDPHGKVDKLVLKVLTHAQKHCIGQGFPLEEAFPGLCFQGIEPPAINENTLTLCAVVFSSNRVRDAILESDDMF